MANRHLSTSSSHHKTSLANRPSNLNARRVEQRRKITTVPEMSPEARRAILLAREDSKVNNRNNSRKNTDISSPTQDFHNDTDNNSDCPDPNNNTITSLRKRELQDSTRISNLNTKTQHLSNRSTALKNCKQSSSSTTSRPPRAPKTGTARSRSTLSQNEPPFSMSDNEISSHLGTNTTSNASVYTSNLSSGNNNNSNFVSGNSYINKNPNNNFTDVIAADDDDNDSALPNDDSFEDEEDDTTFNKNSFVMALDKALEKSYVNRLKGDITDTARVSKPGTVRALNGGRLTNAQEVVVNVCHNDDTELVFHDDDDESIDTAKAISEIRVNIWMEYNSRFPPDNNLTDFDHNSLAPDDVIENGNRKKRESSLEKSRQLRQPSASVTSKPREKSALLNDKTVRKLTLNNPGGGSVKGSSNASTSGTTNIDRSKAGSNNLRLRSIPPSPATSRKSSATSSRGKVNSANSSTTKPTTPLRTRR